RVAEHEAAQPAKSPAFCDAAVNRLHEAQKLNRIVLFFDAFSLSIGSARDRKAFGAQREIMAISLIEHVLFIAALGSAADFKSCASGDRFHASANNAYHLYSRMKI